MKIYLVWRGEYSDRRIIGVYSTRDRADELSSRYECSYYDKCDIEEIEVDAPVCSGSLRYVVSIFIDRQVNSVNVEDPGETGDATEVILCRKHGRRRENLARIDVHCDARDLNHAVKIANDHMTKVLAAGWNGENQSNNWMDFNEWLAQRPVPAQGSA